MTTRKKASAGVAIQMPGRPGEERGIEGWPNLVEVARLAQRHFDEISDPGHGHMAYVGAMRGLRPEPGGDLLVPPASCSFRSTFLTATAHSLLL